LIVNQAHFDMLPGYQGARVSSWGMVENLDAIEKINWPKIIFDSLYDSFAKLMAVKDELGKQHYFNGCAPIFLGNNLSPRSNFFYI
jgi:hypothetical protein